MDEYCPPSQILILQVQRAKIGGMKDHIQCPITNSALIKHIYQCHLFKVLPYCNKLALV